MFHTVLSIEDDSTTQFLNKLTMESAGFCENIIQANGGEEALAYYEKLENGEEPTLQLPEIILLDLNMPVMDGWEFFEAFEMRFPHFIEKTKIFILSSSVNPKDATRATEEKNIAAFLAKPLDDKQLNTIKEMLDGE